MGLRKGEADIKHKVHEKYYSDATESADIHIIENVTEYNLQAYVTQHFGNVEWECRIVKIDPRIFGFGCARPRIYGVIWNVAYMGPWKPDFPFLEVLGALRARPSMVAQDFYWMNLAPSRLTMEQDSQIN